MLTFLLLFLFMYFFLVAFLRLQSLMDTMKFLQFFMLLFAFPHYIVALNCQYGGSCYLEDFRNVSNIFQQKTCKDACVFFKCHVGGYKIMEGLGCHDDFVNTCKYTPAKIKNNIKDYFYVDSSVVYVSCKDGDNCATNAYRNLKETYPEIENVFKYRPFILRPNEPAYCEYDNSPKTILPDLDCSQRQYCSTGKQFLFEPILENSGTYYKKQCDACLFYHCTLDGKTIKTGWGCYDDFYAACKDTVDANVEVKLKENIKDAFYSDKHLAFFSCSNAEYCQFFDIPEMVCYFWWLGVASRVESYYPQKNYICSLQINVNSYVVTKFLENVDTTVDGRTCDKIITPMIIPTPSTTVTSPPAASSSATQEPSSTSTASSSSTSASTPSTSSAAAPSAVPLPPEPIPTTFTGVCDYGEVCLDYRSITPNITTTTKQCNDFCVFYKCLIIGELDGLYNVQEGYGCFNDFTKACAFTGLQTKDKIKAKGGNYQFYDEKLIYVSCDNKDGCAKEVVGEMIAANTSIDKNFGFQGEPLNDILECPPPFERSLNFSLRCNTTSWCKSGREFLTTTESLWRRPKWFLFDHGGVEACEACVSYMCTEDGKSIIGGSGTFDDFERDCYRTLTVEQQLLLNGNEKNFSYADKNVVFMSSDDGYSTLEVKPFETFLKLNQELVRPFFNNIDDTFGGSCVDNSDDEPVTQKPIIQQPSEIFGNESLQCNAGEVSYDYKYRGDFFNTTSKMCSGSCVYYKCLADGIYGLKDFDIFEHEILSYCIKEGYGCFDDFEKACPFTGYQTKDLIKNGGPNYQYNDSGLIYLSCNNKVGCATEEVEKMKAENPGINDTFAGQNNLLDGPDGCGFDIDIGRRLFDFRTTAWCKSGRQFNSNETAKERSSKKKRCDPSISFMCTSDGKLIKGGIGCIEDIKIACDGILSDDLKKTLEGWNYRFFYADENIIVSASTGGYSEHHFEIFKKSNPELMKPFYDNIDENSDELCDYQKPQNPPESPPPWQPPQPQNQTLSSNCGTNVKFLEMILFGIRMIYYFL